MPSSTALGFDPYGVDPITIIIAAVAMLLTAMIRYFRKIKPVATRRRLINDFLNGSVIFPFMLLVFSVFSSRTFEYIKGSKLAVALAGGVGVIFVMGELIMACSPEKADAKD